MDLSTDLDTEIIHSTHHKVLDQITEVTATPAMMIHRIDKASTETTTETTTTEIRTEKSELPEQV